METTKKVNELSPSDRSVVERIFGRPTGEMADAVLILRSNGETPSENEALSDDDELPSWFNVLEGLSDEELAEFDAVLKTPVYLAHPTPFDE